MSDTDKIVHVQLLDGKKDALLWARCFKFAMHWFANNYDPTSEESMYDQYKSFLRPYLNGIDGIECLSLQPDFFDSLELDEENSEYVYRIMLILFTMCLSVHDFIIEDFDAHI